MTEDCRYFHFTPLEGGVMQRAKCSDGDMISHAQVFSSTLHARVSFPASLLTCRNDLILTYVCILTLTAT